MQRNEPLTSNFIPLALYVLSNRDVNICRCGCESISMHPNPHPQHALSKKTGRPGARKPTNFGNELTTLLTLPDESETRTEPIVSYVKDEKSETKIVELTSNIHEGHKQYKLSVHKSILVFKSKSKHEISALLVASCQPRRQEQQKGTGTGRHFRHL
jgi:hypothetical protein